MATLFVIKGTDEGKRFEMTGPVVGLGRDATNAIRLHDTEASRRHAELRAVNDGYQLVDLGSSNGTFLNNQSVKEAPVHSGDHIQIGQTVLVYTVPPGASGSAEDLAEKISLITRGDSEVPESIVKTIGEEEGSRIFTEPLQAGGPWLQSALANLAVMYEATQAVSHILDIDQLLEKIMDLIFQSIPADRGCIMLRSPEGKEFQPQAIRYRAGVDPLRKIAISRTITDYALKEAKGVLVSDASHDDRFGPAQSIVRIGINEAICVPMKGRHETLGVLYLDTRLTPQQVIRQTTPTGKLTEDHLRLAIAIGHQAALALEETRYYQAMIHHERLAAVGQTIAAISHHVKNILQGLKSGNDLLKVGIDQKNENLIGQGWKIVEKNQGRIYDLVMDMLSYSKDREPALEPTDINGIVREVLDLVQGRLKEMDAVLKLRLSDELPSIQADSEGLHRSLLNVVSNALDAMEHRPQPALLVSTAVETGGDWISIEVSDSGVGIPADRLNEIFRPFTSTKGAKGTGLGLAVSRKNIREQGGDILVESLLGKGSKFTIRLPVHAPFSVESASKSDFLLPPPPDEKPSEPAT